jgi:hypothetical protein
MPIVLFFNQFFKTFSEDKSWSKNFQKVLENLERRSYFFTILVHLLYLKSSSSGSIPKHSYIQIRVKFALQYPSVSAAALFSSFLPLKISRDINIVIWNLHQRYGKVWILVVSNTLLGASLWWLIQSSLWNQWYDEFAWINTNGWFLFKILKK